MSRSGNAAHPSAGRGRPPGFFTAPFHRRTWSELLYAFAALPVACAGFVWAVTAISLGAGLAPTFFGFWVLAGAILSMRWLGAFDRHLLGALLGERITAPRPPRRATGGFGWLRARLTDPVAWRVLAFQFVRFPLAIATFTVAVTSWSIALGGVTYWFWRPFLPAQRDYNGVYHRGTEVFSDTATGHGYWLDTPQRVAALTAVGVLFWWLTPWIVRGLAAPHRALGRALLGPVSTSRRLHDLEESRTLAVASATDRLRGIERDLHDGTQARLVALAMNLGQVKEDLEDTDPRAGERARELIARAHSQTKETLAELRGIARGIHPAILDNGLDAALASLASHAPLPVAVEVDLAERPSASSETIAYFTLAELLTNVVKHSGARSARIRVEGRDGTLRGSVADDGRGGALRGAGSGLAGVAQRLGTVDGELEIESPIGGPTVVTVTLPLRA